MTQRIWLAAVFLAAISTSYTAIAQQPDIAVEERLIASCIHQSARGKPWLEKALWGLREQERGWVGTAVRNKDGSYDLGPMQINSWWVPRISRLLHQSPAHVRRWLRDDACFNVEAARWILLAELGRSRDVWTAIGRYHSPTSWRQRAYAIAISVHVDQKRSDRHPGRSTNRKQ